MVTKKHKQNNAKADRYYARLEQEMKSHHMAPLRPVQERKSKPTVPHKPRPRQISGLQLARQLTGQRSYSEYGEAGRLKAIEIASRIEAEKREAARKAEAMKTVKGRAIEFGKRKWSELPGLMKKAGERAAGADGVRVKTEAKRTYAALKRMAMSQRAKDAWGWATKYPIDTETKSGEELEEFNFLPKSSLKRRRLEL
jgi:hypothetical protein